MKQEFLLSFRIYGKIFFNKLLKILELLNVYLYQKFHNNIIKRLKKPYVRVENCKDEGAILELKSLASEDFPQLFKQSSVLNLKKVLKNCK